MSIKDIFSSLNPLRSRHYAMLVFGFHFLICLIILVVGGLIGQGRHPTGTFAAAHVFRYLGHLISLLLALIFVICLVTLRGGWCFAHVRLKLWYWEIVACVFQFLAWIFDAVDAAKLHGTSGHSYGLAVVSTLFGVFGSLLTLLIAISLSKKRIPLAEMCGGQKYCCGLKADSQDSTLPPVAQDKPVELATGQNEHIGKQSV